MAKKQGPTESEGTTNKDGSKTQNKGEAGRRSRNKDKGLAAISSSKGTKSRTTNRKTANAGHASGEETRIIVISSSTTESENEQAAKSREEEAVEERISAGENDEEEQRNPQSVEKKGKQEGTRTKRKNRSTEEDDREDEEEKAEVTLYKFPMNRVSRIIKSEDWDLKISQESVFLLNRAAEKFLHMFCREAYACAFLDGKHFTAYNHLSEAVSKQKRFQFLSEFIPEKLKAEDAIQEAEKQTSLNLDK